MVKPGKHPYELEIEHTLEAMYKVLDCDTITAVYPWDDPVALVTDDEERSSEEKQWNRIIENGSVVKGAFFLCGLAGDSFADMPPELMKKYEKLFWQPEKFIWTQGKLVVFRRYDGAQAE